MSWRNWNGSSQKGRNSREHGTDLGGLAQLGPGPRRGQQCRGGAGGSARALDTVGGFGIFPASGLERLFRDARLGRIHPSNTHFAREVIAKTTLAINPDEQPRWG